MISPENQGVFQLLKNVTFRRILAFCNSRKWGHLGALVRGSVLFWLDSGAGPKDFGKGDK